VVNFSSKNKILKGIKANNNLVNLEDEYKGSHQFKSASFANGIRDKWNNIKNGSLIEFGFNESSKEIVFVRELPKPKTIIKFPKPDGYNNGFWISPKTKIILESCKAILDDNQHFTLQLSGGSGYGKTSIVQYAAQEFDKPLTIVDCSTITDNIEWFGSMGASEGSTYFQETEFAEALIRGNCLILFDEANRVETWISNSLLSVLDHRKAITIRNKRYQAGKAIGFCFSTNEGWEYAGTNPLDKALKGRINGKINVGSLPQDVEEYLLFDRFNIKPIDIKIIVGTMQLVRKQLENGLTNASTRTSLNVAMWVKYGLNVKDAFELAMLNDANEEERKVIVDILGTVTAENLS
jgi:hypothetical protein